MSNTRIKVFSIDLDDLNRDIEEPVNKFCAEHEVLNMHVVPGITDEETTYWPKLIVIYKEPTA